MSDFNRYLNVVYKLAVDGKLGYKENYRQARLFQVSAARFEQIMRDDPNKFNENGEISMTFSNAIRKELLFHKRAQKHKENENVEIENIAQEAAPNEPMELQFELQQIQNKPVVEFDTVNKPKHYTKGGMECIDIMMNIYGKDSVMDFCLCNAFKYLYRCKNKSNMSQDLKKANWYINKFIELNSK